MDTPLIHPASDLTLSLLMKNLPQSLLLTGQSGVGLGTIAANIANKVGDVTLTILPEKDDKVDVDKGVISVDSIRRLYDQTRSKQSGKLVIVIDYAERMGAAAQNAFLKLLEEPGKGVYFILATHTPSKLLPTVASRTEHVEIRPITRKQSEDFLDKLGVTQPQKRAQLLFMAEGLPAELARLANNSAYFEERAAIVRDARDLLQAPVYKKLVIAQRYKDDREGALALLNTASNILRRSITDKPTSNLIHQIDGLLYAYQQIQANGNIRLCLARLVV
jgi:DNA polymerase III delta prime subunit